MDGVTSLPGDAETVRGCARLPSQLPFALAVALSEAKGPDSGAAPSSPGAKRAVAPASGPPTQATAPLGSGCCTAFSTTVTAPPPFALAVALSEAKGPDPGTAPSPPGAKRNAAPTSGPPTQATAPLGSGCFTAFSTTATPPPFALAVALSEAKGPDSGSPGAKRNAAAASGPPTQATAPLGSGCFTPFSTTATPPPFALAVALSEAKGPDSGTAPSCIGAERNAAPASGPPTQATAPLGLGCFTAFSTTATPPPFALAVALSEAKGPDSGTARSCIGAERNVAPASGPPTQATVAQASGCFTASSTTVTAPPFALAVALSEAKGPDSGTAPSCIGAERNAAPASGPPTQATAPLGSGCCTAFSTTVNRQYRPMHTCLTRTVQPPREHARPRSRP